MSTGRGGLYSDRAQPVLRGEGEAVSVPLPKGERYRPVRSLAGDGHAAGLHAPGVGIGVVVAAHVPAAGADPVEKGVAAAGEAHLGQGAGDGLVQRRRIPLGERGQGHGISGGLLQLRQGGACLPRVRKLHAVRGLLGRQLHAAVRRGDGLLRIAHEHHEQLQGGVGDAVHSIGGGGQGEGGGHAHHAFQAGDGLIGVHAQGEGGVHGAAVQRDGPVLRMPLHGVPQVLGQTADGDAVLRLACAYLHQRAEAEDVLQDALLQYLQKAPAFADEAHERTWLLRVAANLCKNRLSYWRRHPQEELSELLPGREEPQLAAVWDAVGALPARYRGVVHLYYYEGYSTVEIARLLGKKEATIRSLLTRARARLRELLKEGYDFEE